MSPPLTQRLDLPTACATSCVIIECWLEMSRISQLQICYIHTTVPHSPYTLHCAICTLHSSKNLPLPVGIPTPTGENHPLAHPTHHPSRHNWCTYYIHWTSTAISYVPCYFKRVTIFCRELLHVMGNWLVELSVGWCSWWLEYVPWSCNSLAVWCCQRWLREVWWSSGFLSSPTGRGPSQRWSAYPPCLTPASGPYHRQYLSYDVCLEVRGEIIRTVLFCIVYWSCAQS